MIKRHIHLAFRNLASNKMFAVINLVGLSMGMTIGLFVLTIISDLTTFDTFHENGDNIHRVITEVTFPPRDPSQRASCPLPVGTAIQEQMGEIATVAMIQKQLTGLASGNGKDLPVRGYYTNTGFLKLFSFQLTSGSIETALANPGNIVLTEKLKQKFFGTQDPVGQLLRIGDLGDFEVTGVISDPPKNSHLQFELLASLPTLERIEQGTNTDPTIRDWNQFFYTYVYVYLPDKSQKKRLSTLLEAIQKTANGNYEDARISLTLQPLSNIIPGPDLSSQVGPKISYLPIAVMLVVALAILFSACINYANLALARSLKKAREVGLRKVLGGSQKQLYQQFLTETMIVALISLCVAVSIYSIIGPGLLRVLPNAGEVLTLRVSPLLILLFLGLAIIAGILAGSLPAFVLSRTPLINALKNMPAKGTFGKVGIRKGLMVFQFALSLFLIIGITVIYRQYQFAIGKDLGFKKEDTLVVPLKATDFDLFLNEFSSHADVLSVSGSSDPIGGSQTTVTWMKLNNGTDSAQLNYMTVDENFIVDRGIPILAGSNLKKDSPQGVVINEVLATLLGASDLVGRELIVGSRNYVVAGIARNFHYMHLEEPIRPFFFSFGTHSINSAYIEFQTSDYPGLIRKFETSWVKLNADETFEPLLLSDQIQESYQFYTNFMKLFGYIALLAISIGCLGLIGMTLYAAQSRIREIAIRKVHGASEGSLIYLLSKSFGYLLITACAIAAPAGYFAFGQLIQVSAYHITIGIVELGSGILLFLILGGSLILSQTLKTARANPAMVLKVE